MELEARLREFAAVGGGGDHREPRAAAARRGQRPWHITRWPDPPAATAALRSGASSAI